MGQNQFHNIDYFQMKKFFSALFLIWIVQGLYHHRLTTNSAAQLAKLEPTHHIVSTFGFFRMSLQKTGCSLLVENFNNATTKYESKGKHSSKLFTGNCEHLEIRDGKIVTDAGNDYMTVTGVSFNYSTTFTIDDEGVIRLIGTFISSNRVDLVSTETVVEDFKTPYKYLRAFSKLQVSFANRYEAFANERKWKFIAEFGQLTIYYGEDPGKKVDYVYSSISIRDSRIYDFSNKAFPGSLFNNVTFEPRCFEPKIYLDFKPPFVFVADPFWPIIAVYEQGGYKILEVSYFHLPQYDFDQNITEINYHRFSTPCPRRTFEHNGQCIAACPAPYYHQIKGETGKCVLVCEEFSQIDEAKRICGCVTSYEMSKLSMSDLVKQCPSDAEKTPYGCRCRSEGEFYDGVLTFDCVKACPERTFGINGVCMRCPERCKQCQRDNFNRLFLECTICDEGYHQFRGQCVKSCQNNHGFSIVSTQCKKCQDANCIDCSNDPKVCLKCNILTTLSNGKCSNNCTLPAKQVYSQKFSTQCLSPPDLSCFVFLESHYRSIPFLKCDQCFTGVAHLDTCVPSCPSGYYSHNGKYCACAGVKNLTIHDQCFEQVACPITMSFDIRSHSCLSCPYGCMSCINTQCTSCNPGYFLYISPQSILCRRKSPLFPCDMQYSWQRDTTCLVTNYTNPALRMTQCTTNIVNCSVCIPGSDQICVLCDEGSYIYNNTCIETCPDGMTPYQNTCILLEIQKCEVPHLSSIHQSSLITFAKIKASSPYGTYIYNNKEAANDPVGYIPVFQDLTTRKNDGVPRDTEFFEVEWICLKCGKGYGLSPDFKTCLPCPESCASKLCYMADPKSCLTKAQNNNNNSSDGTGKCREDEYYDSETAKCLTSCNDPNKYPTIEDNILTCKRQTAETSNSYLKVDSAIYQQEEGNIIFFVFNEKIRETSEKVKVTPIGEGVSKKVRGERLMQQDNNDSSTALEVAVQNGEYIFIEQPGENTYPAYELDLRGKLKSLLGQKNSEIFPNSKYGSVIHNDHPNYIKKWLAIIGYIMSIVILVLHFVFIGNELLYKVDNLLIFVQTMFYFSFAKNLVGKLLGQFYYGWYFSHAGFLPNLFKDIIPDKYVELEALASFKIVNIDGNYFRNAGFSLAWLLIYLACYLVVTAVVGGLLFSICKKNETWYPRVARQALIGGFQFFSMNIMFFSVTQLAHGKSFVPSSSTNVVYHSKSFALAILSIVIISIYTIVRMFYNKLAGIYMLKRIVFAIVLAFSYDNLLFMIPILMGEALFALVRYVLEDPQTKWNKIYIFAESAVFMGAYLLLFLCLDGGVNTIILSIIVFIFIVYLAYDLTTIYLESRDEYPEKEIEFEQEEEKKSIAERAATFNGGGFSKRQSTVFHHPAGESVMS